VKTSRYLRNLTLFLCTPILLTHLGAFPATASAAITLNTEDISIAAPVMVRAAEDSSAQELKIHFGYFGNGDAILLELPGNKTALIDAGPATDTAKGTPAVAKLLKQHGIKRIDYLVLTHPHADHIGGMSYVVDQCAIGRFYTIAATIPNKEAEETRMRETLFLKLQAKGVPISYPAEGDRLDWMEDGKVRVLNAAPSEGTTGSSSEMNNLSLVLQLYYAGKTLLLTGDIETETEQRLVQKYGDGLKSDILKVPHHGSKQSSTEAFLKAVAPSQAFITAGKNNMYGFPNQEVLDRLQTFGATVSSTHDGSPKDCTILPGKP